MNKEETKKYVDFSLHKKYIGEDGEFRGSVLAREKWPGQKFTFMIGHQPTYKPGTKELDFDDPYWIDNVGEIFKIDYANPIKFLESDILLYKGIIAGKEFELIIENDCGFAVAYGPAEIFDYINSTEDE